MNWKLLHFLLLGLLISMLTFGQSTDTILVNVGQAEAIFLKNNLSLLAAHYNIDANTALIKQARLWDNPVLVTDQNLYDGRFFNHGKGVGGTSTGQVYIQVQQLLRTAGKISKLTNIASTNAWISELQYQLLLRNLRLVLHNDLYQVNQILAATAIHQQELNGISRLYEGMKAQWQAGNISQKEFLRIQSLQTSLLQDITDFKLQLADLQNELHTVLQLPNTSFIKPNLPELISRTNPLSVDSLLASAKQNNPDYLLEQANLLLQSQNLAYQKALRVPDINVGAEYDKSNSYVPHYYGLTISLPLPLFNRNQGNIAAGAFTVKQEQTLVKGREQKLQSDIINAYNKFLLHQQLQQAIDPEFRRKYEQLMQNAVKAYQEKQLGLLEFIDLFTNYRETQVRMLQQQYNYLRSKEDLQFLTGKEINETNQ